MISSANCGSSVCSAATLALPSVSTGASIGEQHWRFRRGSARRIQNCALRIKTNVLEDNDDDDDNDATMTVGVQQFIHSSFSYSSTRKLVTTLANRCACVA